MCPIPLDTSHLGGYTHSGYFTYNPPIDYYTYVGTVCCTTNNRLSPSAAFSK